MVVDASAISLASSIIQFIDFACELIADARSIHDSAKGLSARSSDVELVTLDLRQLSAKFMNDANVLQLQSDELPLQKLAGTASSISSELLREIDGLKVQIGAHRKWRSFQQAWKAVMKKDRVQNLETRLNMLRNEIHVQATFIVKDRQSAMSTTIGHLLQEVIQMRTGSEHELQTISKQLAAVGISQDLSSLKHDLERSHRSLMDSIEASTRVKTELVILESLKFASMPVRYSTITEAHERTFTWIYYPSKLPKNDPRSQIRFANWLQRDGGVFWISGKPGSGKSTLMKFLCDNERTLPSLYEWASPQKLVVARFFFWLAGTPMQKSLSGLLQSLLHEIFRVCPKLIPILCDHRWNNGNVHRPNASDEWSFSELSIAFKKLRTQRLGDIKLAFFIDGLDEYDGDHDALIKIVQDMALCEHIKLCVSSRPWNCFEEAFGANFERKLYLQDLTREDIELFAKEKLNSYMAKRQWMMNADERYEYQGLVKEIVNRAQGVFLWVHLVVRSLRDGFVNRDSMTMLLKRLRTLPTDLEPFFEHILRSVDKVYQQRLAQMFQVALTAEAPLPLLLYSFIDEEDPDFAIKLPHTQMSTEEINSRQKEMQWRLNGRTRGLLEVSHIPKSDGYLSYKVDFLHRTVRDFLMSKDIQIMLNTNLIGTYSASIAIARAILAEIKAYRQVQDCNCARESRPGFRRREECSRSQEHSYYRERMDEVARHVRHEEIATGHSDIALLDELERAERTRSGRFLSNSDSFYKYVVMMNLVKFVDHKLKQSPELKHIADPLLEIALMDTSQSVEIAPDPMEMISMLLSHRCDPNQKSGESTVFRKFIAMLPDLGYRAMMQVPPDDPKSWSLWTKKLELLIVNGADLQQGCFELIDSVESHETGIDFRDLREGCFIEVMGIILEHGLDPNQWLTLPEENAKTSVWVSFLRKVYLSKVLIARGAIFGACTTFLRHGADPYVAIEYTSEYGQARKMTARQIIAGFLREVDYAVGDELEKVEALRSALSEALSYAEARARSSVAQEAKTSKQKFDTTVEYRMALQRLPRTTPTPLPLPKPRSLPFRIEPDTKQFTSEQASSFTSTTYSIPFLPPRRPEDSRNSSYNTEVPSRTSPTHPYANPEGFHQTRRRPQPHSRPSSPPPPYDCTQAGYEASYSVPRSFSPPPQTSTRRQYLPPRPPTTTDRQHSDCRRPHKRCAPQRTRRRDTVIPFVLLGIVGAAVFL